MTIDEFNNLKVGDKVYHYRYPHSKYIGSWCASISCSTISSERILDGGVKGFQCAGGGVISYNFIKYWFINERDALIDKLKYMKQWIHNNKDKKSVKGWSTQSQIENKFRTIMLSKKVRKLLLDSNPELFI